MCAQRLSLLRALGCAVVVVLWLLFAILGQQLFSGGLYGCSDPAVDTLAACTGQWVGGERVWQLQYDFSFDDVASAFLTLFEVASLEGWLNVMSATVDSTGVRACTPPPAAAAHRLTAPEQTTSGPLRDNSPISAAYFIVFILVGSFFGTLCSARASLQPHLMAESAVLNLMVGSVIDNFNRQKLEIEGFSLLTTGQRVWLGAHVRMRAYDACLPCAVLQRRRPRLCACGRSCTVHCRRACSGATRSDGRV